MQEVRQSIADHIFDRKQVEISADGLRYVYHTCCSSARFEWRENAWHYVENRGFTDEEMFLNYQVWVRDDSGQVIGITSERDGTPRVGA
jgi:hypothetical protein